MSDFRKLEVWQEAHNLVLAVNDVADRIRARKFTSLRSQAVRAAMSIDANIVEGRGQRSDAKFAVFLNIAVNSANELEAHLLMARDMNAITKPDYEHTVERLVRVRKMLHGLLNRLNRLERKRES